MLGKLFHELVFVCEIMAPGSSFTWGTRRHRRNFAASFLWEFHAYIRIIRTRYVCACVRAHSRAFARKRNAESRSLHSDANSPLCCSFSSLFLLFASLRHRAEALRVRPAMDKSWPSSVSSRLGAAMRQWKILLFKTQFNNIFFSFFLSPPLSL